MSWLARAVRGVDFGYPPGEPSDNVGVCGSLAWLSNSWGWMRWSYEFLVAVSITDIAPVLTADRVVARMARCQSRAVPLASWILQ